MSAENAVVAGALVAAEYLRLLIPELSWSGWFFLALLSLDLYAVLLTWICICVFVSDVRLVLAMFCLLGMRLVHYPFMGGFYHLPVTTQEEACAQRKKLKFRQLILMVTSLGLTVWWIVEVVLGITEKAWYQALMFYVPENTRVSAQQWAEVKLVPMIGSSIVVSHSFRQRVALHVGGDTNR
uniref:Uncharacterized protein n=1 Tax=Chromera velia CCMP2878 TaxID=1169474 RepID=A0A0G4HJ03_9ALVE|eukprot:Cvel_7012.t1-p1 / transcript=Cvel_7012.t1 / gene=Cvel_7012 / organism=Chromera_velia_CCMP2878 / gene_product=hypothetical protein / transcript_product=hypothetical protein / location=Cvel_scaffold357:31235-32880(+) / protein_length=181 / sequence_SO=supercontig / SO=protein_coding / is_pseudo=false